jgi:chaperonin GroEL
MDKVGKDGVLTVEEPKTMETSLELVEGMQKPPFVSSARGDGAPHRLRQVVPTPPIAPLPANLAPFVPCFGPL